MIPKRFTKYLNTDFTSGESKAKLHLSDCSSYRFVSFVLSALLDYIITSPMQEALFVLLWLMAREGERTFTLYSGAMYVLWSSLHMHV